MVPDFDLQEVWPIKETVPYRILPHDVYGCDEQGLAERFVQRFPDSGTRQDIYDGVVRFREEAAGLGFDVTQWVDGSFVSSKIDPDDIDVVTFVDYDFLQGSTQQQEDFAIHVLNGREDTKKSHHTHAFLVLSCDATHPYFTVFDQWRKYWLNQWGKTYEDKNTGQKYPKGFLSMTGGPGPHPQIATT